jgi:hypothetical protein
MEKHPFSQILWEKLPSVLAIKYTNGYFPAGKDFRLTMPFHLVKCSSRCFNTLHSKRSDAASQQAAEGRGSFGKINMAKEK